MNLFFTSLFTVTMLMTAQVQAGEHQAGSIVGTDINLFERDHAFSGEIFKRPVFGAFEHQPFGAKMTIRMGEKNLTLSLKDKNSKYAGTIRETVTDAVSGQTKKMNTKIAFVGVKKVGTDEGEISLSLDGKPVTVMVKGESFTNNHFQNPTYTTVLDGKAIEFKLTGEACFGYSSNIVMMILTAITHIEKH